MKKILFATGLMLLGLMAMTSCNNDSDSNDDAASNTQELVKVTGAIYNGGIMPAATTGTKLQGSISNAQLAPGQTNTIRIAKDRVYRRFYIGIKNKVGYWTYTPTVTRADGDDDEWYEIPINGGSSDGSFTIQVSGEDENGDITEPFETDVINRTDNSMGGRVSSITYNGSTLLSLEYNDLGRVISGSGRHGGITINYGNQLTIYDRSEGITYTASLNASGYITSMSGTDNDGYADHVNFTYDSDGHLLRMCITVNDDGEHDGSTTTQTWQGGNLVSVSLESDEEKAQAIISYGDYANAQHQFYYTTTSDNELFMILQAAGLLGKFSDKLPVKIQETITDIEDDDRETSTEVFTYSYMLNSNGSIRTQTQTVNGRSATLVYSYAK